MAHSVASSEANLSGDSDNDSNTTATTNHGSVADDPVHFSYRNGDLTWSASDGKTPGGTLKGEDVICVAKADGTSADYLIYSLVAAQENAPFELTITPATKLPRECLEDYLFQGLPDYLDYKQRDVNVLVSTLSGTGLAPDFYEAVLQRLLDGLGLSEANFNLVRTSSAESVMEFARSVLLAGGNAGKKQSVLMLSGDGGMVDTINALLEAGERSSSFVKPILAQLPLGTGNALFHSLHRSSPIPSLYVQGLRTLLHGTPLPLPIFRATFSPGARLITNEGQNGTPLTRNTVFGAVVASYGLHATLVADSDTTEYRKHGDKRFSLVAGDLLFPKDGSIAHSYKASLTLFQADGTKRMVDRKEHGYILAALVCKLEKTFTISPASKPLDGQLRVVHFGATDGSQAMEVMKQAYNEGSHINMTWEGGEVSYEAVDRMRITFEEKGESWKWRRCCVDGLIIGVEEGGWMEVSRTNEDNVVDVVVDL